MTSVTVKEALAPPPAPRRRILRWIAISLGMLVLALLLTHVFIVPRIVRSRIGGALRDAGFHDVTFTVQTITLWETRLRNVRFPNGDRAAGVNIRYSPADLWNGRIDTLRIIALRYTLPPREAPATTRNRSVAARSEIPIRRIEVATSELVIGQTILPLDVIITKSGDSYNAAVDVEIGDGIEIDGEVSQTLRSGRFSLRAANVDSRFLTPVAEYIAPGSGIQLRGTLAAGAEGKWDKDGGRIDAHVELTDAADQDASESKLSVGPGVFDVVTTLSPTTRSTLTLTAKEADVAAANLSVQGMSETVQVIGFTPAETPPHQKLTAKKLKIGNADFENGDVLFQLKPTGEIVIEQTRWRWLGGEVSASNVTVPRDGPIMLTLHASNVELKQLLVLLAKEKASGEGKLTGEIPVTIDPGSGMIEFGDARITAIEGGTLQIKDAAAILPTAEAAAQAAKTPSQAEEIKRNIIDALKDFQFERLTTDLKSRPDGSLDAHVRMLGHGRTGAKQGINYELNIHRVDLALKSYLNIQAAIKKMQPPTTGKASP